MVRHGDSAGVDAPDLPDAHLGARSARYDASPTVVGPAAWPAAPGAGPSGRWTILDRGRVDQFGRRVASIIESCPEAGENGPILPATNAHRPRLPWFQPVVVRDRDSDQRTDQVHT